MTKAGVPPRLMVSVVGQGGRKANPVPIVHSAAPGAVTYAS
jgi:hypothetical protein